MQKILRIGHRGACGYAPENTLASFRKAIELAVDMVELDVQQCRSGETVVIHDPRLERTTDGTGRVCDRTLRELKELDAGGGEKIPTLEEALACIDGRVRVNVELKDEGAARPVAAIIEACIGTPRWSYDSFLVSSFDHYALQRFGKLCPAVAIGALIAGIPVGYARCAEKLKAAAVNLDMNFTTREFVRDARGRGMKVYVYTVNEPDDIARAKSLGVDGIFSNYPDRI